MAQPEHPYTNPNLYEVTFPNNLRSDGLSVTYVDDADHLYLEPLQPHDFAFSYNLSRDGFSSAQVVDRDSEPRYVRYPATADLISFPALLNSSVRLGQGQADIVRALQLTTKTLQAIHRQYGALPILDGIDALAVDRATGRAELLPPFHVSQSGSVLGTLERLRENALARSSSAEEAQAISNCFAAALKEVSQE